VSEGGVDKAGLFRKVSRFDDTRLEELFSREVLRLLVHRELLSPEWAERILSWRHTGFSVHSRIRAKRKTAFVPEAPLLRRTDRKGRLPVWERARRDGADGLSGVYRQSHFSYS